MMEHELREKTDRVKEVSNKEGDQSSSIEELRCPECDQERQDPSFVVQNLSGHSCSLWNLDL